MIRSSCESQPRSPRGPQTTFSVRECVNDSHAASDARRQLINDFKQLTWDAGLQASALNMLLACQTQLGQRLIAAVKIFFFLNPVL